MKTPEEFAKFLCDEGLTYADADTLGDVEVAVAARDAAHAAAREELVRVVERVSGQYTDGGGWVRCGQCHRLVDGTPGSATQLAVCRNDDCLGGDARRALEAIRRGPG